MALNLISKTQHHCYMRLFLQPLLAEGLTCCHRQRASPSPVPTNPLWGAALGKQANEGERRRCSCGKGIEAGESLLFSFRDGRPINANGAGVLRSPSLPTAAQTYRAGGGNQHTFSQRSLARASMATFNRRYGPTVMLPSRRAYGGAVVHHRRCPHNPLRRSKVYIPDKSFLLRASIHGKAPGC